MKAQSKSRSKLFSQLFSKLPSKESPFVFLALAGIVMTMTFSAWNALLNNFAIENAAFTGAEIGTLQSIREIPGLLAFTAAFILLVLTEQVLAIIALSLLCIGVAITGFFPSVYGLYATTVLMSIGFHYYETINQSLSLQWFSKAEAPALLGRLLAIKSFAALCTFAGIWLAFSVFDTDYITVYMVCGSLGLAITAWLATHKPKTENTHVQHKKLILRKQWNGHRLTLSRC